MHLNPSGSYITECFKLTIDSFNISETKPALGESFHQNFRLKPGPVADTPLAAALNWKPPAMVSSTSSCNIQANNRS